VQSSWSSDPLDTGLFGAQTLTANAKNIAHLIEQTGFGHDAFQAICGFWMRRPKKRYLLEIMETNFYSALKARLKPTF